MPATPPGAIGPAAGAGAAGTIRAAGPLTMMSDVVARVDIADPSPLLALAEAALDDTRAKDSGAKVSGVIVDTNMRGRLIERNSIKQGHMAWLPERAPEGPIRTLYQFLESAGREYLRVARGETRDIEIEGCWAVDQREGDYQALHAHLPNLLSGIVYLAIPACMEASTYPNGLLTLIDTSPFVVLPIPGTMYVWPAYMLHTVYPFRGPGRRIALSFNIKHRRLADNTDVFRVPRYAAVSRDEYFRGRR